MGFMCKCNPGYDPNARNDKAELILDCVKNDGNTYREYQESRDFITTSLVRDLEHQKEELAGLDKEIEKILLSFEYKLTSMPGIGTFVASKLIAEIGDIRRFPSADKLARFAGVAPVKFSSAGKGKEHPGYNPNATNPTPMKNSSQSALRAELANCRKGYCRIGAPLIDGAPIFFIPCLYKVTFFLLSSNKP